MLPFVNARSNSNDRSRHGATAYRAVAIVGLVVAAYMAAGTASASPVKVSRVEQTPPQLIVQLRADLSRAAAVSRRNRLLPSQRYRRIASEALRLGGMVVGSRCQVGVASAE